MRRNGNIVSYTDDEIKEMIARGEDKTDWERVKNLTYEEIEASIDFEEEGEFNWNNVMVGLPQLTPKQQLTVRFDKDIIDWFKAQGNGYQTKMNAVLRSFVDAQRHKPG